jgi:proteic killer suppression protein
MIISFADKKTERLFRDGDCPAAWRTVERIARRKLDMLDYAVKLGDLRSPPGNRLEALKGDRKVRWSIRINDQWRICFAWSEQGPRDVEIVDYH